MNSYIIKKLGLVSERILPNALLRGSSPDFWHYLREPLPSNPIDFFDVFPELIGRETDLEHLLITRDQVISIPSVRRDHCFFDLLIFSPSEEFNESIIVLRDISDDIEHRQAVQQKRNELSFLNKQIEAKNISLASARKDLDIILNEIRHKSHSQSIEILRTNKELHDSRLWFISTLARAAEFREQETGGHLYRIGRSCVLIGKELGLERNELEILFYASLLHDVGKIGIPDAVLLKPGPLTDEEWKIMRRHTKIGARLMSRSHPLFDAARDVSLNHHEHWNGLGYPNGIKGETIPLVARICAVADVFDALISHRPYKKAWTFEDATNYVLERSEKQFDPKVIKAFTKVLPDIILLSKEQDEDLDELEPEFI